ncbi:hypothetical protein ACD661_00745 [Legionella lytica]|uniref:Ninein n=1 Tax=Legionella lytica TaxID=96232 RepID=A0ABW8D301_9GAMM
MRNKEEKTVGQHAVGKVTTSVKWGNRLLQSNLPNTSDFKVLRVILNKNIFALDVANNFVQRPDEGLIDALGNTTANWLMRRGISLIVRPLSLPLALADTAGAMVNPHIYLHDIPELYKQALISDNEEYADLLLEIQGSYIGSGAYLCVKIHEGLDWLKGCIAEVLMRPEQTSSSFLNLMTQELAAPNLWNIQVAPPDKATECLLPQAMLKNSKTQIDKTYNEFLTSHKHFEEQAQDLERLAQDQIQLPLRVAKAVEELAQAVATWQKTSGEHQLLEHHKKALIQAEQNLSELIFCKINFSRYRTETIPVTLFCQRMSLEIYYGSRKSISELKKECNALHNELYRAYKALDKRQKIDEQFLKDLQVLEQKKEKLCSKLSRVTHNPNYGYALAGLQGLGAIAAFMVGPAFAPLLGATVGGFNTLLSMSTQQASTRVQHRVSKIQSTLSNLNTQMQCKNTLIQLNEQGKGDVRCVIAGIENELLSRGMEQDPKGYCTFLAEATEKFQKKQVGYQQDVNRLQGQIEMLEQKKQSYLTSIHYLHTLYDATSNKKERGRLKGLIQGYTVHTLEVDSQKNELALQKVDADEALNQNTNALQSFQAASQEAELLKPSFQEFYEAGLNDDEARYKGLSDEHKLQVRAREKAASYRASQWYQCLSSLDEGMREFGDLIGAGKNMALGLRRFVGEKPAAVLGLIDQSLQAGKLLYVLTQKETFGFYQIPKILSSFKLDPANTLKQTVRELITPSVNLAGMALNIGNLFFDLVGEPLFGIEPPKDPLMYLIQQNFQQLHHNLNQYFNDVDELVHQQSKFLSEKIDGHYALTRFVVQELQQLKRSELPVIMKKLLNRMHDEGRFPQNGIHIENYRTQQETRVNTYQVNVAKITSEISRAKNIDTLISYQADAFKMPYNSAKLNFDSKIINVSTRPWGYLSYLAKRVNFPFKLPNFKVLSAIHVRACELPKTRLEELVATLESTYDLMQPIQLFLDTIPNKLPLQLQLLQSQYSRLKNKITELEKQKEEERCQRNQEDKKAYLETMFVDVQYTFAEVKQNVLNTQFVGIGREALAHLLQQPLGWLVDLEDFKRKNLLLLLGAISTFPFFWVVNSLRGRYMEFIGATFLKSLAEHINDGFVSLIDAYDQKEAANPKDSVFIAYCDLLTKQWISTRTRLEKSHKEPLIALAKEHFFAVINHEEIYLLGEQIKIKLPKTLATSINPFPKALELEELTESKKVLALQQLSQSKQALNAKIHNYLTGYTDIIDRALTTKNIDNIDFEFGTTTFQEGMLVPAYSSIAHYAFPLVLPKSLISHLKTIQAITELYQNTEEKGLGYISNTYSVEKRSKEDDDAYDYVFYLNYHLIVQRKNLLVAKKELLCFSRATVEAYSGLERTHGPNLMEFLLVALYGTREVCHSLPDSNCVSLTGTNAWLVLPPAQPFSGLVNLMQDIPIAKVFYYNHRTYKPSQDITSYLISVVNPISFSAEFQEYLHYLNFSAPDLNEFFLEYSELKTEYETLLALLQLSTKHDNLIASLEDILGVIHPSRIMGVLSHGYDETIELLADQQGVLSMGAETLKAFSVFLRRRDPSELLRKLGNIESDLQRCKESLLASTQCRPSSGIHFFSSRPQPEIASSRTPQNIFK